ILPIYNTKQHFSSKRIAIQKIEEMLRCHIRVTVGKQVSLQNLHESYLSSEQLFPYLFLIKEPIITYENITLRTGIGTDCTPAEQAQLTTILLEDDPITLKQWIH